MTRIMPDSAHTLRQALQRDGRQYLVRERAGGSYARICFVGSFLGQEVIWDAQVWTLRAHRRHHPGDGRGAGPSPRRMRNFIEIRAAKDTGEIPVTVAINVPAIDDPTLLKTVIMIRNYRQLRPGYHAFGEDLPVPGT
jgi:hypothetical protein